MRKGSLLFMDKNPFFRGDIVNSLENEGYEITVSENGQKAIQLLHENRFDLVITGMEGGPVDGIGVLKIAKKNHPEIMVIILTSHMDINSAIKALQYGADDYILKPCKIDEIHYRVEKCLEKQKIKRRIAIYENMISICGRCKKVKVLDLERDDPVKWVPVENYIRTWITAPCGRG
jgi:DNA-binding NtrC family response regulator